MSTGGMFITTGAGATGATACGSRFLLPVPPMSPAALMSIIAGKAQAAATGVTATINAPIELASLIQSPGRLLGTGQCLPI